MKMGFKIVETPIVFMDRRVGKSKMSRQIVIEGFTYVLRTRFSKKPVVRAVVEEQNSVGSCFPKKPKKRSLNCGVALARDCACSLEEATVSL